MFFFRNHVIHGTPSHPHTTNKCFPPHSPRVNCILRCCGLALPQVVAHRGRRRPSRPRRPVRDGFTGKYDVVNHWCYLDNARANLYQMTCVIPLDGSMASAAPLRGRTGRPLRNCPLNYLGNLLSPLAAVYLLLLSGFLMDPVFILLCFFLLTVYFQLFESRGEFDISQN